jgi:paraquat-inducible protein A
MPAPALYVCHDCDLICRHAELAVGESACCPRCHAAIYRHSRARWEHALALALTSAILLLLLNFFPLLALKVQQNSRDTTLFYAVLSMWENNMHTVALLVMLTTIVAPLLQLGAELHILLRVRFGAAGIPSGMTMWWLQKLRPWSLVEVFMLGLLVSLVKLKDMADIIIGPAFWSCAGLIVVSAALSSIMTPRNVWLWSGGEHACA